MYDIRQELFFFYFDEGGRRGYSKNFSKEVGLTLESLSSVTELLTNGTYFLIVALSALRLSFKSHTLKQLESETIIH